MHGYVMVAIRKVIDHADTRSRTDVALQASSSWRLPGGCLIFLVITTKLRPAFKFPYCFFPIGFLQVIIH